MSGLHRAYIRQSTKEDLYANTPKDQYGNYINIYTGKSMTGPLEFGHRPGYEYRYAKELAEKNGMTQKQFNDQQNDSRIYFLQEKSENRGHEEEAAKASTGLQAKTSNPNNLPTQYDPQQAALGKIEMETSASWTTVPGQFTPDVAPYEAIAAPGSNAAEAGVATVGSAPGTGTSAGAESAPSAGNSASAGSGASSGTGPSTGSEPSMGM